MRKARLIKRAGFTLVEMLVVLAVLAILVSLAVPAVNEARNRAKNTQVKTNINDLRSALERYGLDHNNFFPGINYTDLDPQDQGGLVAGPGVIGGVSTSFKKRDFMNPMKPDREYFRNNYYGPEGEPLPWVGSPPAIDSGQPPEGGGGIDKLLGGGYLEDYPANPFLASTGGSRSQMANTMLLNLDLEQGTINIDNEDHVKWNRFLEGGPNQPTMRTRYDNYGRGYFTYIPLDPVNQPPLATSCSGNVLAVDNWDSLSDDQKTKFYKHTRSYVLIGWGHSRKLDSAAAGISQGSPEGVFNESARNVCESENGGPDFDGNLTIDLLENNIGTIMTPHLYDSEGTLYENFGDPDPLSGFPNLNPGFHGAVIITGNNTETRS